MRALLHFFQRKILLVEIFILYILDFFEKFNLNFSYFNYFIVFLKTKMSFLKKIFFLKIKINLFS